MIASNRRRESVAPAPSRVHPRPLSGIRSAAAGARARRDRQIRPSVAPGRWNKAPERCSQSTAGGASADAIRKPGCGAPRPRPGRGNCGAAPGANRPPAAKAAPDRPHALRSGRFRCPVAARSARPGPCADAGSRAAPARPAGDPGSAAARRGSRDRPAGRETRRRSDSRSCCAGIARKCCRMHPVAAPAAHSMHTSETGSRIAVYRATPGSARLRPGRRRRSARSARLRTRWSRPARSARRHRSQQPAVRN